MALIGAQQTVDRFVSAVPEPVNRGLRMADSNITKRALASSLKELMAQTPFEKISVAQICENCDMHRKSFYYHFKDKYELLNWIFDTEIIKVIQKVPDPSDIDAQFSLIQNSLDYFYANRVFYRKAFQVRGQNSFREHFQEYIRPLIHNQLKFIFHGNEVDDFDIDLYSDVVMCTMERWLLSYSHMPPDQVVTRLKLLIQHELASLDQIQPL